MKNVKQIKLTPEMEVTIESMKAALTIVAWNQLREEAKTKHGNKFVSEHIDASGLIGKTSIKSSHPTPVNPKERAEVEV